MDSQWSKSSYSNAGSDCVEARVDFREGVQVRDTQYPAHGHLAFPSSEWRALLADIDSL
ncbi:DUF397 domain-containing protein [Nocardiopsis sediminis]|uniref:DUF397 domain-containing protein n=1 Tax=Nocardiopsis sediminis TaxID=1778267 RepID=A0ABV8FR98_9ACTN